MKSIGDPLTTSQSPAKRMRLNSTPRWEYLPSELFIAIFESMKNIRFQIQKTLPPLCIVCSHWARCGEELRLKLTNFAKVPIYELFKNNMSCKKFIENHSQKLTHLDLSSMNLIKIIPQLPYAHLTNLQTLVLLGESCDELKRLTQLTELRLKMMTESKYVPNLINKLANMTNLRKISAPFPEHALEDQIHLLTNLTNLQSINSSPLKLTDTQLYDLSLFTQLTDLELKLMETSTATGYGHLSSLTKLKRLAIGGSNAPPPQLQFVKNLTQLQEIDLLDINDFSNNLLQPFSLLENLLIFRIGRCNLNGNELQFLMNSTQLQELNISACSKIELQHIVEMTSLKKLKIDSVIEEDVPLLSTLANLSVLNLGNIKNDRFQFLANLTNLAKLTLGGCTIPLEASEALVQVNALSHLTLASCNFDDEAFLRQLSSLENLKCIKLHNCQLTNATFSCLPLFTTLRKLTLEPESRPYYQPTLPSANPQLIQWLTKLTSLEKLKISTHSFSPEELSDLTSLQKLNLLRLYVKFTEAAPLSFPAIRSMFSQVEELEIHPFGYSVIRH